MFPRESARARARARVRARARITAGRKAERGSHAPLPTLKWNSLADALPACDDEDLLVASSKDCKSVTSTLLNVLIHN